MGETILVRERVRARLLQQTPIRPGAPFSAHGQRVSIDAALHTGDKPYVQATGEATVSVKPDQALIEIGVVTQGTTAAGVAAQNAMQSDTIMMELRKLLGTTHQIKTTNYSVRLNYKTPKSGAAAVIAGYIATNVVEITLDDLTMLRKVVDVATQSGRTAFGICNID